MEKLVRWAKISAQGKAHNLSVQPEKTDNGNSLPEKNGMWGPERETFTHNAPPDFITFNSLTDDPGIGDERNFIRFRRYNPEGPSADDPNIKVGEQYDVFVYFFNDTSPQKGDAGTARNVRLKIECPEVVLPGKPAALKAVISSPDSVPESVWDTVHLKIGKSTEYLRYVPGSAMIYTKANPYGAALNDRDIGGKGILLSADPAKPGEIPCSDGRRSGYVKLRIQADQPGFYAEETASVDGGRTWKKIIEVKDGDIIEFRIRYHNTGTTVQRKVTVFDRLPGILTYIKGSTRYGRSAEEQPEPEKDGLLSGGLIIGDFRGGDECYIYYKAAVNSPAAVPDGVFTDMAAATGNGTIHARVKIFVK